MIETGTEAERRSQRPGTPGHHPGRDSAYDAQYFQCVTSTSEEEAAWELLHLLPEAVGAEVAVRQGQAEQQVP